MIRRLNDMLTKLTFVLLSIGMAYLLLVPHSDTEHLILTMGIPSCAALFVSCLYVEHRVNSPIVQTILMIPLFMALPIIVVAAILIFVGGR